MLEIHALLNPKSASDYSGTFGGIPDITPEMVAASLAGAPAGGSSLIRAKLGDTQAMQELLTHLRKRMAWEAGRRFWKTGPRFAASFEGLIMACAIAYVSPQNCRRCKGRGTIQRRTGLVEGCQSCGGTGHRDGSEFGMAKMAGISYTSWCDVWSDRARDVMAVLSEWEDAADRATKRVFWDKI